MTDEAEQANRERMKALRAQGMSYGAIAGQLNDDGTPARKGGRWHAQTVSRALQHQEATNAEAAQ